VVFLKHRTVQVFFVLALYLLLSSSLPYAVHQWFYTVSLLIKDLLIWMMPITVGCFIAHAVCSFQYRAPLFIFVIILFEAVSNFSSVWIAFIAGHFSVEYLPSIRAEMSQMDLSALFRLPFTKPAWWSAEKGTLFGLVLGCVAAFSQNGKLVQAIQFGKKTVEWVLTRIFSRLIPLFVLGFVARMVQTNVISHLLSHYAMLLVWLVFLLGAYIGFLFVLGAGSFKKALTAAKNLFPAATIAFSSGCSLSTMPWTIDGVSKNLKNPDLAKAVIPATTNIQQIGDCLVNAFLCFLIYRHFFGENPSPFLWIQFSLIFILARFATAAILGGAVFLMLPIYETYLHFNAEMIALILALNVILDPLVTCANVVANGALCRLFEKTWNLFSPPIAIKPIQTTVEKP